MIKSTFIAAFLALSLAACAGQTPVETSNNAIEYNTAKEGYNCDIPSVTAHAENAARNGWYVHTIKQPDLFLHVFNNTGEPSNIVGDTVYLISQAEGVPFVFLLVGNDEGCVYTYNDVIPRIDKRFIARVMQEYNGMRSS